MPSLVRHLANTIELSVCGGDAALCQITLTTCYYSTEKIIVIVQLCASCRLCGAKNRKIFWILWHLWRPKVIPVHQSGKFGGQKRACCPVFHPIFHLDRCTVLPLGENRKLNSILNCPPISETITIRTHTFYISICTWTMNCVKCLMTERLPS